MIADWDFINLEARVTALEDLVLDMPKHTIVMPKYTYNKPRSADIEIRTMVETLTRSGGGNRPVYVLDIVAALIDRYRIEDIEACIGRMRPKGDIA